MKEFSLIMISGNFSLNGKALALRVVHDAYNCSEYYG